jgi:hypothetical protein
MKSGLTGMSKLFGGTAYGKGGSENETHLASSGAGTAESDGRSHEPVAAMVQVVEQAVHANALPQTELKVLRRRSAVNELPQTELKVLRRRSAVNELPQTELKVLRRRSSINPALPWGVPLVGGLPELPSICVM